MRYPITLVLAVGFSILAFVPPKISARMLGSGTESRLWGRLVGILGLVYIVLGLAASEYSGHLRLTPAGKELLLKLKDVCAGVVIGLLVAWATKRHEKL